MRRLVLAAVLATAFDHSTARADCATGASYQVTVSMNTVTVCPVATARTCGSAVELLRQNVADGTVVVVNGVCAMGCYVDSCVAPGMYRYGYATAYDCSEAGCGGVTLFEKVTVTNALPPTCTPAGNTTPTAIAPPWESGGADADIPEGKICNSGCACTATVSPERVKVRILDGLAVLVGLCMIGLRAGRRRRPGRGRS